MCDFSYDGKTLRPDIYACRDRGDIDLATVIPTKRIKRLAIKVVDIFGNEYTLERKERE